MIAAFGPMLAAKPDAPVDMMQLPAIATIQSKLFGGVSVTTVEGSEFVMRSYSPFGTQVGIGAGGAMMAGMMLPALNTAREKARRVSCLSNLKQIGLACHVYADKHDGKFPPYLDVLFPDYLPDKKVLICPSASHEGKSGSSDYVYAAGGTTKAKDQILAYDNTGNHRGVGRNVLFTDGHVEWMMESTFQQRLRQNK
jgi:prepilin-type processing-associated H-X9-DG protein